VLRRLLVRGALVALVLAVVAVLAVAWLVRRPFPDVTGVATVAGLNAEVQVLRDEWGVPHIYAGDAEDLFRAQGYVHAQDRFWQMEMSRRVGAGRLSELFGADQLDTDRFLRTLGWRRVAEEEWDLLGDETRAYLTAYAEGVNAYLDGRSGFSLSFEHGLLGLQNRGLEIEPWHPLDTLTWLKVMAWDLRTNMESEIRRALLSRDLPIQRVQDLWPPYPDRHPDIVTGGEVVEGRFVADHEDAHASAPPPLPDDAVDQLATLLDTLDDVPLLSGPAGAGVGSNSWVVDGERTASGLPILANDPHLGAELPSIWYEVGLHCDPVGPDCPFDVRGFSFAGMPGVIIGRTPRIAWGLTNLGADVTDLFVERVDPDEPDRYEVEGEFVAMEVVEETIEVAGDDPVEHRVRLTRNGPVMSDVSGEIASIDDESAVEIPDEHVVALRWTALDPGTTIEAVFALNRAEDWDDFRAAVELFEVPAQNLVYADVDGNIGYQTPGRIPIRAGGDGRWPVPGWTGDYDWIDEIPFEELPSVLNPPEGYIQTANQRVISGDYPHHLTADTDWAYGHRGARLVELLEPATDLDAMDVATMQLDAANLNARAMVPYLEDLDLDGDERLEEVRDLIVGWDHQQDARSAGAAAFEAWWRHLLLRTFTPAVPEGFLPQGNAHERWYEAVRRLAEDDDHPWWGDPIAGEPGSRDEVMRTALADAVEELGELLGDDPDGWAWGDLHTLDLVHDPLGESGIGPLERLVNRGPYRTSGGNGIVNATGWNTARGYEVVTLPSFRMVVDLADPDGGTGIHTTGQSGHAFHRHYDDMAAPWARGETKPMRFTRAAVEDATVDALVLRPPPG
jgi:penicillin G amidase